MLAKAAGSTLGDRCLSFERWAQFAKTTAIAGDGDEYELSDEEDGDEEQEQEYEESVDGELEGVGEEDMADFAPGPASEGMKRAILRRAAGAGPSCYFPPGISPLLRRWWDAEFGTKDAPIGVFQEALGKQMAVASSKIPSIFKAREKVAEKVMARALGLRSLRQPLSLSACNFYSLQLFCEAWAATHKQPRPRSVSDYLVVVFKASGAGAVGTDVMEPLRVKLSPCTVPERLHVLASSTTQYGSWVLEAYDAWLASPRRFLLLSGHPAQGKSAAACLLAACRSASVSAIHLGSHGDAQRNNPRTVITSIIFQMCHHIPNLQPTLAKVLKQQSDLSSQTVRHMFEGLLLYPLTQLESRGQATTVVVLDNLCAGDAQLLRMLPQWFAVLPSWVRFVVTAEPGSQVEEMVGKYAPQLILATDQRWEIGMRRHLQTVLRQGLGLDAAQAARASLILAAKAEGSLEYATCKLRDLLLLSEEEPDTDFTEEIKRFPQGLSSMWEETVGCMSEAGLLAPGQPLLESLLPVVVAARQPLSYSILADVTGSKEDAIADLLLPVGGLLPAMDGLVMCAHRSLRPVLERMGPSTGCPSGHRMLADWQKRVFGGLRMSSSNNSVLVGFQGPAGSYALRHVFAHIFSAGDGRTAAVEELAATVCNLGLLKGQFELGRGYDFCRELAQRLRGIKSSHSPESMASNTDSSAAEEPQNSRSPAALAECEDVLHFLHMHCSTLQRFPHGIIQEALSCPQSSVLRRRAEAVVTADGFKVEGLGYWRNSGSSFPPQRMTLQGHMGRVTCVTVLEDGTAASGSDDKIIRLWDLDTSETLKSLRGHRDSIRSLAGTMTTRRLASGSDDGTIRVWDLDSGDPQQIISAVVAGSVLSLAWLPGGCLASGTTRNVVSIWQPGMGVVDTAKCKAVLKGHAGAVTSLQLLSNGRLSSGSRDHTIIVWDLQRARAEQTLNGHTDTVLSLTEAAVQGELLSSSADGTVRQWDLHTGSCRAFRAHTTWVNSVRVLPDARLVTCGDDETLRLWSADRKLQRTITGHQHFIRGVAVVPNSSLVVSCSDDMSLRVWDVADRQPSCVSYRDSSAGHSSAINAVAVLRDGRIASGGCDSKIVVWSLNGHQEAVLEGQGMDQWVTSLAVLGGDRLAVGSYKRIHIWKVSEQRLLKTLSGHGGMVNCLTVLLDGRLVSGSADENIMVWDVESGERLALLKGQANLPGIRQYWNTHTVHCVESLPGEGPEGQAAVASGASDKTVRLWDPDSGNFLRSLCGHVGAVLSLARLPQRRLASGSEDKLVIVWDLASRQVLRRLGGHTSWVRALCSTPAGHLVSAADDRTLRLWDTATFKEARVIRRHGIQVSCLSPLPDGRVLSGAADPPCVCLWPLHEAVPQAIQFSAPVARFIDMAPTAWMVEEAAAAPALPASQ